MKEELLARYRNLITGVVSVDHRIREGIEQYKAKLLLADGSNAAHHPEIKSHPHHLHTAKEVRDSSVRNLDDVLAYLAKKIE